MNTLPRCALLLVLLTACSGKNPETAGHGNAADSAFAEVQRRGAQVMGVDQYTSSHIFEDLPDGGRIVLRRDSVDPAGVETIRTHMRDIADRFSRGDFTLPGVVHDMKVPGTDVMAAHRDRISYLADTLPGGGQLRIMTRDPEALAAVHAFLAFQRLDHRAAGNEHAGHGS